MHQWNSKKYLTVGCLLGNRQAHRAPMKFIWHLILEINTLSYRWTYCISSLVVCKTSILQKSRLLYEYFFHHSSNIVSEWSRGIWLYAFTSCESYLGSTNFIIARAQNSIQLYWQFSSWWGAIYNTSPTSVYNLMDLTPHGTKAPQYF